MNHHLNKMQMSMYDTPWRQRCETLSRDGDVYVA